nr:MAG TPA: hypothetical protein [Caudoviricetes sp.]
MASNELIENEYKIDIDKLKIGQVFKNKREMCELLGQKYISNKTASLPQLKEWKRYIDWEKDGQKIIVTEIYPTPLDKNDGRITNGTQVYQRFIEDILLAYIDSQITQFNNNNNIDNTDDGYFTFSLTLNQLALLCGMINENYVDKNITQLLLDAGYTKFNIKDFFSRTQSKFNLVINNALNNMQKRKIISYEKKYIVVENGVKRIANYDDESKILNIEKTALIDMGCGSVIEVFVHNKTKEYYNLTNKYVGEQFGWNYYYQSYVILANNYVLNLEKDYLRNTNQQNKLELNKKLTTFFNSQAKNKVIKSNKDELNGFRLPANYNSQQKSLTEYLLNIENNQSLM